MLGMLFCHQTFMPGNFTLTIPPSYAFWEEIKRGAKKGFQYLLSTKYTSMAHTTHCLAAYGRLATRNMNRYLETNMSGSKLAKHVQISRQWFTMSHCWWSFPSCWLWQRGGAASPRPRPSSPAPALQSRCPAGGRYKCQLKYPFSPGPPHAVLSLQAPPCP